MVTVVERHRRNQSKRLALLILEYHDGRYLTARELSRQCPVSYAYLRSRLPVWARWHLVKSAVVMVNGRPTMAYCLGPGGRSMLARYPNKRAEAREILLEYTHQKISLDKALH